MLSNTILRYGRTEPLPQTLELRAGPLTMTFDPLNTYLRHIRLGDHEVVRAFYAAVRDDNWRTIPPKIANLESHVEKDSFRLAFDAICRERNIDYVWRGVMTGDPAGRIQFKFDGTAQSDFLRNRIGICILHPITECAGHPCVIEHVDGQVEQGSFPRHISPHQPFHDIRGLSYEVVTTSIRVHLEMDGDVFEMEDQRNWSDASFKTYCTPLARLLPHPVKKGDTVQQSVELSLSGHVRPILPVNIGRPPQLSIATTPVVTMPPLGLSVASHGQPLSARQIERLKALRLSHLRVDLRLDAPDYPAKLERAATEATQLGAGLHVALILCEHARRGLPELVQHFERLQPKVLLWIVLHESENPASERTVQQIRPTLQKFAPNVLFAAGTKDFFTEVNRVGPEPGASSFICYSNNPQVHAFDDTTLVENLAGMASNVESAKLFTPRPVLVSPITLRIRDQANAPDEKGGSLTELPSDVDPRQLSLFGGGWTLGSIARLATTGFVHSLTYYETTGWRGVLEAETGSSLPEEFPSHPGMVFPIYHVLADIGEFPGKQIYPTHSSHPLQTEALTLFDSRGRRRVLVANLTGEPLPVKIKTGTCEAVVKYLDETNAEEAMLNPEAFRGQAGMTTQSISGKIELKLLPCALARVDIG